MRWDVKEKRRVESERRCEDPFELSLRWKLCFFKYRIFKGPMETETWCIVNNWDWSIVDRCFTMVFGFRETETLFLSVKLFSSDLKRFRCSDILSWSLLRWRVIFSLSVSSGWALWMWTVFVVDSSMKSGGSLGLRSSSPCLLWGPRMAWHDVDRIRLALLRRDHVGKECMTSHERFRRWPGHQ